MPQEEGEKQLSAFNAPVRYREFIAIVVMVVIAHITLYHGQGYAGLALFSVSAVTLLAIGSPYRQFGSWTVVLSVMSRR